jgi:hypothetical protein
MVIHPKPELLSHATFTDEIRNIFVGDFLSAKTCNHAEDISFLLCPD